MATEIRVETREAPGKPFVIRSSITLYRSPISNHIDHTLYQVAIVTDNSDGSTSIRIRNPEPKALLPESPLWRILQRPGQEPLGQRISFAELIHLTPGQQLIIRRSPNESQNPDQLVIACRPSPSQS